MSLSRLSFKDVPAGWMALYSILATHRIPEIYPDPDPDRFSPQRQEHKRPFSLIGFGGGPRLCIGIAFAKMEMKIIAAYLLRGYQKSCQISLDTVRIPTSRPLQGFHRL